MSSLLHVLNYSKLSNLKTLKLLLDIKEKEKDCREFFESISFPTNLENLSLMIFYMEFQSIIPPDQDENPFENNPTVHK